MDWDFGLDLGIDRVGDVAGAREAAGLGYDPVLLSYDPVVAVTWACKKIEEIKLLFLINFFFYYFGNI